MTLPKSLTTVTTFSKTIALFLFILLPFAGFYVGYNYHRSLIANTTNVQQVKSPTPTTDPTASWKIYLNKIHKYSIKYPPDWVVGDFLGHGPGVEPIEMYSPDSSTTNAKDGFILIRVDSTTNPTCNGNQQMKIGDLNGFKTKKIINGKSVIDACATDNKYIYIFNLIDKDYSREELFDQILSTFKFTDAIQVTETTNWKTYANRKYGYQIKIPPNWYVVGPYAGQASDLCLDLTITLDVPIIEISKTKFPYCGFVGDQLPAPEADITIWVKDTPRSTLNGLLSDRPSQQITIGNIKGVKYIFTENANLPDIQASRIYFNNETRGFLIFLKQNDKIGNYDPIYDQILSTFKFTQ